MIKKLLILSITILATLSTYAQDNLIPIDPNNRNLGKHLAAGAFVGYGVTVLSFTSKNYKPAKAVIISASISAALAISKEAIDKSNGFQPDKLDVVSTIGGSIVGSLITNQVCKLLSKNKHKNNKR